MRSRLSRQASAAEVDAAVSPATEASVCRLVQSTRSKGEGRSGRQQRACDIWADAQEAEEEGHLPGFVSVTSKKEERRDTWSESDSQYKQTPSHQQQNVSRSGLRPRGGTDVTPSWTSGVSGTRSGRQSC